MDQVLQKRPLLVFILGMHRSGTSCLTGSLEQCGLNLGAVQRSGKHNARGNHERKEVEQLHDQILKLNGGSWNAPPQRIQVHPYHTEKMQALLHELDAARPAGVKDPRMLLVLEEWERIAPPPIALIGTFRHPMAVARSLAERNGMPLAQGIELWRRYNELLVVRHRKGSFPLVEFRLDDPDAYCAVVASAAAHAGLEPTVPAVRRFVSTDLEHQRTSELPVPDSCRDIYEYLMANRTSPRRTNSSQVHSPQGVNVVRRAWQRLRTKGIVSLANTSVDRLRAEIFLRRLPPDAIRTALFFVGSARSGTTLINTLLSAHPMILLGHEVHTIRHMYDGRTWPDMMREIVQSAFRYERTQTWTGYSYRLPMRTKHNPAHLRVIGDKRASETSIVAAAARGFRQFLAWVPYPVTFLHVARHPLDVISTQMRREGIPLRIAIPNYFRQQMMAETARTSVTPERFLQLHLEDFIAQPRIELRRVIEQLGLPVDDDYLDACASIVFPQPKRSRQDVEWTAELVDSVRRRSTDFPQLQTYCADEESWRV